MKREIALPAAAWLCGAGGFLLRRYELAVSYDEQTRLMSPSAVTWVLIAGAAVLLLLAFLACRDLPRAGGQTGGAGRVYLTLNAAAAFLLLAAGAAGLWQQSRLYAKSGIALAAWVMCFVSGAAVLAAARQTARDARVRRFPVLLMAPAFCYLLFLIARYQQFAREPVLLIYVWRLLALAAVVLALYFMVSLSLDKAGAARVAPVSLWAIFLTLTSLGDGFSLLPALMAGAALLYLTGQAYLLLRPAGAAPSITEEITSEENDDER